STGPSLGPCWRRSPKVSGALGSPGKPRPPCSGSSNARSPRGKQSGQWHFLPGVVPRFLCEGYSGVPAINPLGLILFWAGLLKRLRIGHDVGGVGEYSYATPPTAIPRRRGPLSPPPRRGPSAIPRRRRPLVASGSARCHCPSLGLSLAAAAPGAGHA